MTKTMTVVCVVGALIVGGGVGYLVSSQVTPVAPIAPSPAPAPAPVTPPAAIITGASVKNVALHSAMRKLWEEHIAWTRLVILSIVDNTGGKDQALARLLKNYSDMEAALVPYYGDAASEAFGALMKDHLTIAAELVTESKAGNTAKAADAEKRWYANADALADFLSAANPANWPREAMKTMLYEHLTITKQEAVDRITKNYADDVVNFDKIHDQALMMADGLSDGIVNQFPDKF